MRESSRALDPDSLPGPGASSMTLRSHLLVLIAATLMPMLAFAVVAAVLFVRYQSATFQRGATERTLALLTALDTELRGSVSTLEALATSATLDAGDVPGFHAEAHRRLGSQSDWLNINLALPSGQQVANALRPSGRPLPPVQEQPSFARVLATRQPAVSDLVVEALTGEPGFAVRVPVVRDGVVKYVLSAVVTPRAIAEILAAQRLPTDWVGVVLDGNERIVSRTVDPEGSVGQLASESLRAALARGPEGWFRGSTIEGSQVYTPYNRSTFSGWTVAMGIPASAVGAATWRTIGTLAVGALVAAGAATFLALLLARRIAMPITALATAASAVGRGDAWAAPRGARVAEVRDLARVLDEAAAVVRARDETQGRLAAIVESSSDAVISYSLDGVIETWNPAAARLFGYDSREITGRHISVLVPPERVHVLAEILAAVARGEARALETERLRRDGTRVQVALHASPIRGVGGAVTGVSTVIRDVTERKLAEARLRRSEERLRESEERLRLALAGAGQGTWDWDLRTGALVWDEHCRAIHGLTADAPVTYEGHLATVHPDDRERMAEAADQAVGQRSPYSEEYRVFLPDRQMRWILAQGTAYCDEAGKPVRMAGTALDITERKRAEEALRAADRAKDEFLAMLGHELRNPLGAIAGAVGILGAFDMPDERAALARAVIGRQVAHLSRLVDDLLDVSRVSSGKVMLSPRTLDLGELVTGLLNAWRTTGRLDRHRVSVSAAPVWIEADEARMEQIVANLVGNALKYTPPGGSVAVRVAEAEATAVLEVADTGAGIPAALLDRIFEPFVQGERGLDRSQGGLGLGLALVKQLVEAHGGQVTASSEGSGTGAVFTVRMPRARPMAHPRATPAPPPATTERRRVLLVEDNDDAREMMKVALALAGHEVHEAVDGPRAVEAAMALKPDVALIDVGLPEIDGYEVARRIRGRVGAGMQLVAITGYGQAEDRRRAADAGFDVHLTKPVTPERLLEVVARRTTP